MATHQTKVPEEIEEVLVFTAGERKVPAERKIKRNF
jgi:hypothetical protein